jgi:AraC family transcriptional regulator
MPAMKVLAFKPRTAIDYQARINRVLAHMAEHLDADPGAAELARVANLSAFHFHRIFRAITGETIGGLTRRLRLERAGQALRRGAPLIEVALDAGYGSPEAFGRAFREAFGITPTAYRKVRPPPVQRPLLSLALQLDPNNLRFSLEPLHGGTTMDVRVETYPERLAVCARHIGPYTQVGPTFRRMYKWAAGAGVLGSDTLVMGLSYDNPETHAAEEMRYDVCFSVRSPVGDLPEGLRLETLPAGRFAVHTLHGPYSGIYGAFRRLFGRWLPESGEEIDDRACMEIYLNDPTEVPEAELRTEICIPIK